MELLKWLYEKFGLALIWTVSSVTGLLVVVPSLLDTVRSIHTQSGYHWPVLVTVHPIGQLRKALAWGGWSTTKVDHTAAWMHVHKHMAVLTPLALVITALVIASHLIEEPNPLVPRLIWPLGWPAIAVLAEVNQPVWPFTVAALLLTLGLWVGLGTYERFKPPQSFYGSPSGPRALATSMAKVLVGFAISLAGWPLIVFAKY